jgi:hypothetical protein
MMHLSNRKQKSDSDFYVMPKLRPASVTLHILLHTDQIGYYFLDAPLIPVDAQFNFCRRLKRFLLQAP